MEPQKPVQQKTSDWGISELYRSAINMVKRNKVLWLFGLALGATGSYSYNGSSHFNQKDIQAFQKIFQNSPQTTHKVLGAATNVVGDTINYLFSAVSPMLYIVISLELIVILCVGIVISLIYRGWAEAGLLESIENALNNKPVTIKDASEKAFTEIKPLLWIRYVPILVVTAIYAAALILTLVLGSVVGTPIMAILLIFEILVYIGIVIMLSLGIIWAVRVVVVDKKPGKIAFFAGLKIAKKKFWSMLGLGILNVFLVAVLYGVLLIPLFVFLFLGIIAIVVAAMLKSTIGVVILVAIGATIFIALSTFIELGSGILTAFTTSVWSLAYNKIRGKYDN